MESWTNVARCLRHGLTSKIPTVQYDLSLEKMSGGLGNRLPKYVETWQALTLAGIENGEAHNGLGGVVANYDVVVGEFAVLGGLGRVVEVDIEYIGFGIVNDEKRLLG